MEKSFPPKQFDWDEQNISKNWKKHKAAYTECEEIFFNEPLFVSEIDRSKIMYRESRYIAYGTTNAGRLLTVVFTVRGNKIRVISARDMGRPERRFYNENAEKTDRF